jgi:peptidoglycan/xylan/chitin deacetylase (PgdA/CDA1 family)
MKMRINQHYIRPEAEEEMVTQLQEKEEYEEQTKPVFETEAGFVTLTFDDGPSVHTERILEILAQKEARAIFFMLGSQAEKNRTLARKVVNEGHVIGNHSYSHPYFTKLTTQEQEAELKRASDIIADITGVGPRYFRPPYGAYNEETLRLVLKNNMKPVMWSADPRDYTYNTAGAVFGATEPLLASRKILLLHDLKSATVEALPLIIDAIRAKKLKVTKEYER